MSEWLSVTPGIDMTAALDGKRLTKKWLREYLAGHPEKDFRNHTGPGAYVNGEDALRYDLTFQVMDARTHSTVAVVVFQRVIGEAKAESDWGYQAVVR